MEIVRLYPENTDKRTVYKLTKAQGAHKLSECVGNIIKPDAWALYKDINAKDGSEHTVLTMMSDNAVYATNSPTFIRDFMDIVEVFGDGAEVCGEVPALVVLGGTSKAGRNFITCTIE